MRWNESGCGPDVESRGGSSCISCTFVGDQPLVEQRAEIARECGLEAVLVATGNGSFRRLSNATGALPALTDVFRFPTVRTFAAHLGALAGSSAGIVTAAAPSVATGTDRGARRRQAVARRRSTDSE